MIALLKLRTVLIAAMIAESLSEAGRVSKECFPDLQGILVEPLYHSPGSRRSFTCGRIRASRFG